MLLRKDLHSMLGRGEVAFIKTKPNSELRPEDIKRLPRGDPRQDYITLQWLIKPEHYDPTSLAAHLQTGRVNLGMALAGGANVDALFRGEGGSLPSPIILDYTYGIQMLAQPVHVGNVGVPDVINNYTIIIMHIFRHFPLPHQMTQMTIPTTQIISRCRRMKRHPSTRRRDESELAKAMDELNVLLMHIWDHARRGYRAQAENNRAAGTGSSGSEQKQSVGVAGRLLKCIHPIVIAPCTCCINGFPMRARDP
ncbi:hypothetical protein BC826DRAFT_141817 [Russula brevipes]|nr:hypothetical protein BC826DRAFT_141817 [Russula brevipes]